MKKIAAITLILIMSVFLSSCSNQVSHRLSNHFVMYTSDYMNSEYFLFDNSEHIVKAKLVDIGSWGGLAVYEYKVKKEYQGELSETIIHVYDEEDDRYKKGRKYYLFLINNGEGDRGHIRYTSIIKNTVFAANERNYTYGYGENWYTLKRSEIPEMIEEAKATRAERNAAEETEKLYNETNNYN